VAVEVAAFPGAVVPVVGASAVGAVLGAVEAFLRVVWAVLTRPVFLRAGAASSGNWQSERSSQQASRQASAQDMQSTRGSQQASRQAAAQESQASRQAAQSANRED